MLVKTNKRYINKINYLNRKKIQNKYIFTFNNNLKKSPQKLIFFLAPHFGECTQQGVDIMVRDRQIRKATKSSTE